MNQKEILSFYSRKDICEEIVKHAQNREVAVKFGDSGFGKRPDVLKYPRDVLEFAKRGASSFHVSEELWKNPLHLETGMKRHEIDDLRIGWDLVIDIDFVEWESTKIICDAVIDALKKHGIKSISCKFSGNKGFHVGVPFEAFPKKIVYEGKLKEIRLLFPEGVRRIASYLIDYIDNKENSFSLSKKIIDNEKFREYLSKNGKSLNDFSHEICEACGEKAPTSTKSSFEFVCPNCEYRQSVKENVDFMSCPKCKKIMQRFEHSKKRVCPKCKGSRFLMKIDVAIDTILISNRHLYRSVYSLHEKSGLVSVPVDINKVLNFSKEDARPEKVMISKLKFLDRENVKAEEAKNFIIQAFDYMPLTKIDEEKKSYSGIDLPDEKIPTKFFPPCIKCGLDGIEDGRKRFLFSLVNFLVSCGWNYDEIESVLSEWNKKNKEPLRDNVIVSHIRYHKQQKKKILPPNCVNKMYYLDIGICKPDNLCKKIKNPVNYAKIKARSAQEEASKT